MDLEGKSVLVVGAGKSGIAASRFLLRKGARVTLTDSRSSEEIGGLPEGIEHENIDFALGKCPGIAPASFRLVVVSPGIPLSASPVKEALEAGLEVIGEVELAFRFARSPVVAITGTNGKTTTTALTGDIFRDAGYNVLVGGNIGLPLVESIEEYGPGDVVVAEVSSFQMETVSSFRPRVALILNVTPDHLDRHGDMEGYAAAKGRIAMNQKPGDYLVLNYDNQITRTMSTCGNGDVIFFSRQHILERGVFVRSGMITARIGDKEEPVVSAAEIAIPGSHNLENALAAVAAALIMGVPPESAAGTLRRFPGVEHRLEHVAEIGGVRFINDSKGTNPDASIKAVEAYDAPLVLIAGGKNKGNDFTAFVSCAAPKTRALVVLGQCAGEIAGAAARVGIKKILRAGDLREAVFMAGEAARPGDVVLLSPACASWDMFKSYEERGNLFKNVVRELEENWRRRG